MSIVSSVQKVGVSISLRLSLTLAKTIISKTMSIVAAADPYLLYGGYGVGHLGYAGSYYGHGLGYYGFGKREAEPKADADPYLLYGATMDMVLDIMVLASVRLSLRLML